MNHQFDWKDDILASTEDTVNESVAESARLASCSPLSKQSDYAKPSSGILRFAFGVCVVFCLSLVCMAFLANDDGYIWWLVTSQKLKLTPSSIGRLDTSSSQYGIYRNAASAAISANRKSSYKKLLMLALVSSEKQWGKFSIYRGDTLMLLCACSGEQHDWVAADFFADELIKNQETLRGVRDSTLADAYALKAWIANEQTDFIESKRFAETALLTNERCCDPESPKLKNFMKFTSLLRLHKASAFGFQNGGVSARHAESRFSDAAGPGGAYDLELHLSAFYAEAVKDYARAEKYYKMALERSAVSGDGLQCTATILNDYSCMLHSCGRHEEAKAIERKVDAIRLQIYSREEYGTDALIH